MIMRGKVNKTLKNKKYIYQVLAWAVKDLFFVFFCCSRQRLVRCSEERNNSEGGKLGLLEGSDGSCDHDLYLCTGGSVHGETTQSVIFIIIITVTVIFFFTFFRSLLAIITFFVAEGNKKQHRSVNFTHCSCQG